MTSSSKNILFNGYIASVLNLTSLRNYSTDLLEGGASVVVTGSAYRGDGEGGIFTYEPLSTATDDNLTVIAPVSGNGRWLLSAGRGQIGNTGPQGVQGVQGIQGQGLAEVEAASGSMLVGHTPVNQSATTINSYLDRMNVWVDNVPDLTAALALASSSKTRTVINLKSATYALTTGLIADLTYVSINGHNSTFDVSAMTSGVALTLTGSSYPPYTQNANRVSDLYILGAQHRNSTSGVTGVLFSSLPSNGGSTGPSHTSLHGVSVNQCYLGFEYGEHTYLVTNYHCEASDCAIGVHTLSTSVDSGENLRWVGGAIFNNHLAIKLECINTDLKLDGTSIDYNTLIANISAGTLQMINCHCESSDYATTPIVVSGNGVGVIVSGGRWLLSASAPHTCPYWVSLDNPFASFVMRGTAMNNANTASGYFATGPGYIKIDDISAEYQYHGNCMMLSDQRSRFVDGGFEQPSIVDDIYIAADTAAITDRHTGANLSLAISTDSPHSGAQCLKVTKVGGGGSPASFNIAIPVASLDQIGSSLWFKAGTANVGPMFIAYAWQKYPVSTVGYTPTVEPGPSGNLFASLSVDMSAASTWTQQIAHGDTVRAPAWATHYVININISSVGAGTMYFDDFYADKVG